MKNKCQGRRVFSMRSYTRPVQYDYMIRKGEGWWRSGKESWRALTHNGGKPYTSFADYCARFTAARALYTEVL